VRKGLSRNLRDPARRGRWPQRRTGTNNRLWAYRESDESIVARKSRKRDGAKGLYCKHVCDERRKADWQSLLRNKR